jgi:hypothetical protein
VKKKKPTSTLTPRYYSLLRQILNYIPNHLVPKLARETGVDYKARTFSPWSHVVALIFAQLTHAVGLNDVCDALRLFSGSVSLANLSMKRTPAEKGVMRSLALQGSSSQP